MERLSEWTDEIAEAITVFAGLGCQLITSKSITRIHSKITTKEKAMTTEQKQYKGRELVLTKEQIGKCRDCNEVIGWLTSQRTQKMYCVNVKEDMFSDQYNCVSNDFHRCD